jgi:hypothetical protein
MPLNLYSKDSVDNLLAGKVDLAGATMTGALTLSASGIIFSDSTYLTTAPAGSTLAADQLTAGVVTANPTSGPSASGDVLQYNGTDLVWAAGGGGLTISTLSNGATSTLDATAPLGGYALTYDGTNLIWASVGQNLAANQLTAGTVSSNPSTAPTSTNAYLKFDGSTSLVWTEMTISEVANLQTELDGKLSIQTVNSQSSAYTLVDTDANNIVYGTGSNLIVPKDSTYDFAIGTIIVICTDSSSGFAIDAEDTYMNVPSINGSGSVSIGYGAHLVKVAANTWRVF